jgi:MFS superfamily sulfate permease-like transporter
MTFLAVFLGVIVAILLVVLFIIVKIKRTLNNSLGVSNLKLILNYIKEGKYETEEEAYSKDKSLGGMTNIYEPQIRADFKDFNLSLLYLNIESCLRDIFSALNKKNISVLDDEKYILIRNNIVEEINDMKLNNIDVNYKDIEFKKHVIKSYIKKDGTATITTASLLSYYYTTNRKKENYKDIKKGTIYICEFVYVYDESKFEKNKKTISINCPNCGAIDGGTCVYCGTYAKPINLKAWKIVSYKEDKRN